MKDKHGNPFVFPEWVDSLRPFVLLVLAVVPAYLLGLLFYAGSPTTLSVGYEPEQPVPYSHALHAGELGIDCRYCHSTVETSSYAAIPPTETCMNCHTAIHPDSEKLAPVRESYETGMPIPWVKVHLLPDYAYFNHSAHVRRGVGCVECHGRVDTMEVVYQVGELSMGWCLDCHRNPGSRLRPVDEITNMAWQPPEDPAERDELAGRLLGALHTEQAPEDCSTCHR